MDLTILADDALFALRPFGSSAICVSTAICRTFWAVWQTSPAALKLIFPPILITQIWFYLLWDFDGSAHVNVPVSGARKDHWENRKNRCCNVGEGEMPGFAWSFFHGSQRRLGEWQSPATHYAELASIDFRLVSQLHLLVYYNGHVAEAKVLQDFLDILYILSDASMLCLLRAVTKPFSWNIDVHRLCLTIKIHPQCLRALSLLAKHGVSLLKIELWLSSYKK